MFRRSAVSAFVLTLAAASAVATSYIPWTMTDEGDLAIELDAESPAEAHHFAIEVRGESRKERKPAALWVTFEVDGQLTTTHDELDSGDLVDDELPARVRISVFSDNGLNVPAPQWVDVAEDGRFFVDGWQVARCDLYNAPCTEGFTVLFELEDGEAVSGTAELRAISGLAASDGEPDFETTDIALTIDAPEAW